MKGSGGSHKQNKKKQTHPADLCFVLGMPWDLSKFFLSMGKLALTPVSARSLLFPATAELCFVETQLPVVRAWTVTIRDGVLGDGGGRRSQSAVGRRVCARVLGLDLPGHQLRSGEIVLGVCLGWVELAGEHRKSGSTKCGRGIHSRGELLEVIGEELLQRSGFTDRGGIGRRMLMSRTEWLSLYSGNSRILWDNHIKQLLSVSSSESWHGVCEICRVGHYILKLLIEGTGDLRLTERHISLGLNESIPRELPLRNVIIDLEIVLIAAGEGGEGGLIAMGPILVE